MFSAQVSVCPLSLFIRVGVGKMQVERFSVLCLGGSKGRRFRRDCSEDMVCQTRFLNLISFL